MNRDMQQELIRRGAEQALADLKAQMAPLETLLERGPRPGRQAANGSVPHKRRMSPAMRKAVSLRMRKYWAEQRKAK